MNDKRRATPEEAAFLVTFAAALSVMENFLPRIPLPGVRLGLANLVTIIALYRHGVSTAIEIAAIRSMVASFVTGSFLSPSFFISFTASVSGAIAMAGLYGLGGKNAMAFSPVGISVFGAFVNNMAQLLVVFLLLIQNKAVFAFIPYLGISAVITGAITGLIASGTLAKTKDMPHNSIHAKELKQTGIKSALIMTSGFIFAVFVLLVKDFFVLLFLSSVIAIILMAGRGTLRAARTLAFKAKYLILFAAITPIIFDNRGREIARLFFISVTDTGLNEAAVFALRIFLMVSVSAVMSSRLTPHEMAAGLVKILLPLKVFGIDAHRVSAIIACSWAMLPDFMDRAVKSASFVFAKRKPGFGGIIEASTEAAASVYGQNRQN